MQRKILITECYDKLLTVLLENDEVVELHYHPQNMDGNCALGEIYVGKVKQILPNTNGAFIEIKKGVECYFSLEEKCEPIYTNKYSKKPELCIGDELIVQVQKEAVKTKLPMVSANLNFTGKYAVLTSGNRKIGVSTKIPKTRREELISFGEQFQDIEYGLIFRTNAQTAKEEDILQEIQKLEESFQKVTTYGKMRTCYSRLLAVPNPAILLLQDFKETGLTEIVVDKDAGNGKLYEEAEEFIRNELPEYLPFLRGYSDPKYPLHKCYRLEHFTEEARREQVWMKSGAYLVIQPTEALTVIDVNSGKCLKKGKTFYDINLEAAKEAAKQIRLRNISGIILVDFVNMDKQEQKEELLKYFQQEMNRDSNPGKVIDMTRLQLVEVTRKKVRKTLEESLHG